MPTPFMPRQRGSHNTHQPVRVVMVALAFIVSTLIVPRWSYAASMTVTTTNDSGTGSLRQGILDANASLGFDTISFNIPGSGVHTIDLQSVLPPITDPVTIDGYTQPGAQPNTLAQGSNATLRIELNGAGILSFNPVFGLKITGGNSTVRGLVINRFGYDSASTGQFYPAFVLETQGDNVIEGNYIGTDAAGVTNLGNGGNGVDINNTADNTIGGTTPAARNVISGHGDAAVKITGPSARRNSVQGNYIGTNANGTAAIGNLHGVIIAEGADNVIGGTGVGTGNIISGNRSMGIAIYGPGMTRNRVQGNFIGTDAGGTIDLGNGHHGIQIVDAVGTMIGGTVPAARNLISGNDFSGIHLGYIGQGDTRENVIQGNFIGTDVSGSTDLGNGQSGLSLAGATTTIIGGTVAGAGNLIAGNDLHGIVIRHETTQGTVIQGNIIGPQSVTSASVGNAGDGIHIEDAPNTTIGGWTPDAGNVIAYNQGNGVSVDDSRYSATGNAIASNAIFANNLLGIAISLNRQAAPALLFAYNLNGATTIGGSLTSQAGTTGTVQFFASQACDPSGIGEGETLLGTTTVPVDNSGAARIHFQPAPLVELNHFVTALATDSSKNTSPFSMCVKVIEPFQVFIPIVHQ